MCAGITGPLWVALWEPRELRNQSIDDIPGSDMAVNNKYNVSRDIMSSASIYEKVIGKHVALATCVCQLSTFELY